MSIGSFKYLIEDLFIQIASKVEYKNRAGYTDINKELEDWLGPIFNRYFDAEFVTEKSINAPAIDTADRKKAIAIQITSTTSNEKIKKTLIQVYKNNYHKEFDNIYILFLKLDSSDVTFNLQLFRNSQDFTKLAKENEWRDEIFNPATHIIDFRKIIDTLASHKYANFWDDIISELKNITGYVEGEHIELKNYLAKGGSINEILNPDNVAQSLKIIKDYFGPFIKLPNFIFLNLQLFDKKIGISLEKGYLNSNNTQLINNVKDDLIKNSKSELIEFLVQNGVLYIYNNTKKHTINLKNEYQYFNGKCNICAYRKLEILNIPKTNEENVEENLFLWVERLYFLVEYGMYEDSILLFEKLLNHTKDVEKYGLTHFHLVYNFKKFYDYYLPTSFMEKKEIFKNLNNYINRDLWVLTIDKINYKETRLIMEYHIKLLHIEDQSKTLTLIDIVNKILNSDKKGGDSSSMVIKLENDTYHYIWNIYSNTAHNKILFDTQYTNASMVLYKSLEILLSISSLKNPRSHKVKTLNSEYLEILINHLNYSDLANLLLDFKNKAIILQNKESIDIIHNTCIRFLKNTKQHQSKKTGIYKKNLHTFAGLNYKINTVIQNIATIYNHLEFSTKELQEVSDILITLFNENGVLNPRSYGIINEMFHMKQKQLPISLINKIRTYYTKFPNYFDEMNFVELLSISDYDSENTLDELTDVLINRKSEVPKDKFRQIMEAKLDQNFSFYHYRIGVLFDVVDFNRYQGEAIQYLKNALAEEKKYKDPIWSSYESKLVKFIEMLFKEKLNPNEGIFSPLKPEGNDYIDWLMNLSGYPKEKFDPYWVTLNYSSFFYEEFAKHQYIKSGVAEYLKTNEQPRLTQIYFQYFHESDKEII